MFTLGFFAFALLGCNIVDFELVGLVWAGLPFALPAIFAVFGSISLGASVGGELVDCTAGVSLDCTLPCLWGKRRRMMLTGRIVGPGGLESVLCTDVSAWLLIASGFVGVPLLGCNNADTESAFCAVGGLAYDVLANFGVLSDRERLRGNSLGLFDGWTLVDCTAGVTFDWADSCGGSSGSSCCGNIAANKPTTFVGLHRRYVLLFGYR